MIMQVEKDLLMYSRNVSESRDSGDRFQEV